MLYEKTTKVNKSWKLNGNYWKALSPELQNLPLITKVRVGSLINPKSWSVSPAFDGKDCGLFTVTSTNFGIVVYVPIKETPPTSVAVYDYVLHSATNHKKGLENWEEGAI